MPCSGVLKSVLGAFTGGAVSGLLKEGSDFLKEFLDLSVLVVNPRGHQGVGFLEDRLALISPVMQ